jgi:endoglucanase
MSIRQMVLRTLVLFVTVSTAASSAGYLHTAGKSIVDGSGTPFLLRGMGLGGWLVPEGYMIGTSGFANSPTEFTNLVVASVGAARADSFFQAYRKNYVTRTDIDSLARWGFNSIRLPMHYNLLTPKGQPGVYLESGFVIIDTLLAWCEANHIYLILDLHCAPGSQNSANIGDYVPGEPSLWESAEHQRQTVDLWKTLARRYATREWIGGYDLLNETVWDLGSDNAPMRALMIQMTDSIRSVDTNHIIFVEGNNWATDFTGLSPAWDKNMVYSFHKYWNSNDASSITGYLLLRENTGVPLWLGESGENSNAWFTDCINLMESHDIGWSWWTLKKMSSIAGPLSSPYTGSYTKLLSAWAGGAGMTADQKYAALMSQAENLKIAHCIFRPDYIDAMMRLPKDPTRRPFAANEVPGQVFAVNYDYGPVNVAYKDVDFQATTQGGSWNSGWEYRNDGVDIEQSTDPSSNGYNVGWTAAGDYLTYTVNVATTGTYQISLELSAPAAGGSVLVRMDGVVVALKSVPATGGWQVWQETTIGSIPLTAGPHLFRVDIVAGGFNFAFARFTQVPDGIAEKRQTAAPSSFSLAQNFPNPFNPTTTVNCQVPVASRVKVTVYDLLGRQVAVLMDEKKEPGTYAARWDATGVASGMYLCRMEAGDFVATRRMALVK